MFLLGKENRSEDVGLIQEMKALGLPVAFQTNKEVALSLFIKSSFLFFKRVCVYMLKNSTMSCSGRTEQGLSPKRKESRIDQTRLMLMLHHPL